MANVKYHVLPLVLSGFTCSHFLCMSMYKMSIAAFVIPFLFKQHFLEKENQINSAFFIKNFFMVNGYAFQRQSTCKENNSLFYEQILHFKLFQEQTHWVSSKGQAHAVFILLISLFIQNFHNYLDQSSVFQSYEMGVSLLKQSPRSRSVLQDGSRSLTEL